MIRLWLIRHGETQTNVDGLYSSHAPTSLTTRGIEQAQNLHTSLRGVSFGLVLCSELERTQHTVRLVLSDHQLPVHIIPELDKMFFDNWEMRHHRDLMQEDTENYSAWCNDWRHAVLTNGEGFQTFSQHMEHLIARFSEFQHYQNTLVVSYQGVLGLLIARLVDMPAEAMWHFRVDQGCWSAIGINQKFATLRVLNSRAIGVENAWLFCFFTGKPQRPLTDPGRLMFSTARLFSPDTTLQKLFCKNDDAIYGVGWDDSPLSRADSATVVPKSPLIRVY